MSLIADASRAASRVFEESMDPTEQFWKGTPLYNQIPVRKITGNPIRQQIEYLKNTDGGYADPRGDLDKPRILDQYTQAEWPWAFAYVPYALADLDIAVNKGKPEKLFDLLMAKRRSAVNSLKEEKIEPALFGEDPNIPGQPTPDPNFLQGLSHLTDNDNTAGVPAYGSIAVSDAPRWAAIRDATPQFMSEVFLERKFQLTYWENRQTDLIMTTSDLITKYIEGLLPRKRSDSERTVYVGGIEMKDSGGIHMKFRGARLFKADKCPDKAVFLLMTKGPNDLYSGKVIPYIWLAALEDRFFVSRQFDMPEDSERISFREIAHHQLIVRNRAFQQGHLDVT